MMQIHYNRGTQTQKASKTQKRLRRYTQQRSQRALHAGMEKFSWGEKVGELGVTERVQQKKETFMFAQKTACMCIYCLSKKPE